MKEKKPKPPQAFISFFRWYCHPLLEKYIEGDLLELYEERIKKIGKTKADLKFIIDVLFLFRPGIIRPTEGYHTLTTYGMYKSYFKIGWRNLLKSKGYSFINIGGLAMGMTITMLIGFWIYDELQFNNYHQNHDTIARVMRKRLVNGETVPSTALPYGLADELKTKYGDSFRRVVNAWPIQDYVLSTNEKTLSIRGEFIEPAGIEMLSLRMHAGTWAGLDELHSILISQSAAKAFFGDDDPMDKVLRLDNQVDVKITGVYEDLPYRSHFYNVNFFAPWELCVSLNKWMTTRDFRSTFLHVYAEVKDKNSFEAVSERIKNTVLNKFHDDKEFLSLDTQLFLHPMNDWRLRSEWKNGINTGGLIQIVWLFGIVAAFVLMLACINFMNLSTARAEKRAKEIGVRKATGSNRAQLITQFFSESLLVVILAFALTLLLVSLSLPWFNELAGKPMKLPWDNVYFWLTSLTFVLTTGIIAGSYPALYLSSFNPIRALKGTMRVGRFASIPRKVLVVTQFAVSVTLIFGTAVVYQQIQFAKNRPIGYHQEDLLLVQIISPEVQDKLDVLEAALTSAGIVKTMAASSSPPTDIWNAHSGFEWEGKAPNSEPVFGTIGVSAAYGATVGWKFIHGRDFSDELASDSASFVVNEAAAKLIGLENPVGKIVRWQDNFTIIGVVQDMISTSPYGPAMPTIYFLRRNANWINIRISPRMSTLEALPKIEETFKKIVPSAPFTYKFADEEYALKFLTEERIAKLASVFAAFAIVISCLGLFGLASFIAEQRTKEIGIRKIVGASVPDVWAMLSKDFVVLVVISCIIAFPMSNQILTSWLKKYEYHTDISWWTFATVSVAAVLITLLTVSYQALKSARMNPVKSLRSE